LQELIMEVHHHPELHHKKKNFKEYFLEFLMIFLAVTLGFFAENIREHFSNKQNEQEYIISLVKNLQDDTADIKKTTKFISLELSGIDSLYNTSKDEFSRLAVQDSVYYFSMMYLNNINEFEQNDATIVQLRNAGGYRLIQKDHVADSIAVYERRNNDIKDQAKYYEDEFKMRYQYFNQIFDWKYANEVYSSHKIPDNLPVAVTTDKEKINLYYNQCFMMRTTLMGYDDMLNNHLDYLIRIIKFLKNEYSLQ
jgi:hypothetical protein